MVKYHVLNQIQHIVLDNSKSVSMVWKGKNGKEGDFSVRQAYCDLSDGDMVNWHKTVWFSQNIPKHAFVLRLAVKNKLLTQDKIKQWGSYDMMVCPLCYCNSDSHNHLFFQCSYTSQFWEKVKVKLNLKCNAMEWNDIMDEVSKMYNGDSIESIIRRLGLAASVYLIWQERNNRLFIEGTKEVGRSYIRCFMKQ